MTKPLSYDPNSLSEHDRYKLLISLVIPRPIALVTTLGPTGVVNAAPFSFFNLFSESPPLAVLGLQAKPGGSLKDTSAHIRDRGEFVINLVDEALGEQMNQCAVDFPPEISEVEAAKLNLLPSEKIKTPRIAECMVQYECQLHSLLTFGRTNLVIGKAVMAHVREDIIADYKIDPRKFSPLGRIGGRRYVELGNFIDV